MRKYTETQDKAIHLISEPLSVIAAAGSGKTTVLVERYLKLIESGLKPEGILTITFTNEAADQLRARILEVVKAKELLGYPEEEDIKTTRGIGTIHSFCYQVLTQYGSVLNLPPLSGIVDNILFAERFESVYANWLSAQTPETLSALTRWYHHAELKTLAKRIYQLKRVFFRASLAEDTSDLGKLLRRSFKDFSNTLHRSFLDEGYYAFDDLEHYTLELLENSSSVREALQTKFGAVLVDEFQDTSPIQWKIIHSLIGEKRAKLFVVGDPKQSIYRFRNADSKLFELVSSEIEDWGGSVVHMNTNFRTAPNLLSSVNSIGAELFAESAFLGTPMEAGLSGSHHSSFEIIRFEGGKSRTDAIEREIEVVSQKASRLGDGSLALLFRNSDRMPRYQAALAAAGVESTASATHSLFRKYDVWHLIGFLKSVLNPLDDFSLTMFLRSPYVGFSMKELFEIYKATNKTDPLIGRLMKTHPKKLNWFFALLESGELRTRALLSALFQNTSHWPSENAFSALVEGLAERAHFARQALLRIEDWAKHEITVKSEGNSSAKVRLMTVHSAKGLEFDHVFLVDLLRQSPRTYPPFVYAENKIGLRYKKGQESIESGVYKTFQEENLREDIEESKRVLYVALTRARKTLSAFIPKEPKLIPKNTWAEFLVS